ncbi:hypothetical protein GCM10009835_53120 [Planosporangium flavigriseum]|uniref:Uncharacterized protein n=1 Tax=Planosporangium flavigriseum TaxID=373681 RepID=A0A8J3LRV0_9ACTN|nr:hypothetical protein Pfl04_48880 [Planosporangium flavigriseum]
MLVVVPFVGGVPVALVYEVDVVAVLDLLVPAALAVAVWMVLGLHVLIEGALVVVPFVRVVDAPVVQVVDVVTVLHAGVPAGRAVFVIVAGERLVPSCRGHGYPLSEW